MDSRDCLLLASQGAEAERIAALCRGAFGHVEAYHGNWGDSLPDELAYWSGGVILSYCSRWLVPHWLLDRASIALNFHPAPPEYPGIGGLNWALYNGDASFGVTCHHMVRKVDAGPIVEVRRFPILPEDNVPSLFDRTHQHLEAMASDILTTVSEGRQLPLSGDIWSPPARKRADLDSMMTIWHGTTAEEIARRERAFVFNAWRLTEQPPGIAREKSKSPA